MKRHCWAAFGAAFLLHISAVLWIGHYHQPTLWENGTIAQNIRDGYGYSIDFAGPKEPTSWQAPGYPLLLWGAWSLVGQHDASYLLISIGQSVLLASIVFPIAHLTACWLERKSAVFAAWLAALFPLYCWYSTRLHQPAMIMGLYPWLLLGWLSLGESGLAVAALTGACTGLAGLFSPTLLGVFGLISATILLLSMLQPDRRLIKAILVAGCCTLVVLAPWTYRNYQLFGRFIPIKDSFGLELWKGNNPEATGTPMTLNGGEAIALPDDLQAQFGKLHEIDLMDELHRRAVAFIKEQPGLFVRRTLKRIAWLWTAPPASLLRHGNGGEAVKYYWLNNAAWGSMVLLSILGLVACRRVSFTYALALIAAFLVYSATYGVTLVGQARYRGEVEFLLIPLAAAGLRATYERIVPAKVDA